MGKHTSGERRRTAGRNDRLALRVELLTGTDERTRAFLGTVSSYQPGTGEFRMFGASMRLASGATVDPRAR
jgi:hypothetical protein